MRRFQKACLFIGTLPLVLVPTFCFLMATWHARTLDYGERWGVTGFIAFFAFAGVVLIGAALGGAL